MRRAIPALVALALLLLPVLAQAAPTTPLGHTGRWITDAKGRTVIMHGVNMVYKRPPYYPAATGFGDDDAAFLQRNGFNVVRLGVIYAGVEPSPGSYDDAYLNQIAATESTLAKHGIFSQLDFHQDLYNERFQGEGWPDWAVQDDGIPNVPQAGFPNNYFLNLALIKAFDHFWANSPGPGGVGLQDRYAAAWEHVASRFAAARHTVGFDLLNEPWPGTPWATCVVPTGCPAFDSGVLGPFYRRVLDRVRTVDRQKLVWYEPNVLFNFGSDTDIQSLGDRSTGFSFHVYCTAGGGPVCNGLNDGVFQNAEKHSAATGDALMVTEFGATDDLATIQSNVDQADRHLVSWEYWHYCECQDPTTTGTGTQAVVVDPNLPPTGSNVKQQKLDVLSQPYPQLVAGTPTGWQFDPATRTFQFTYTTKGPGGKKFARRGKKRSKRTLKARQSEIFLGRARYPKGYRVSVRGGGIASKPKAGVLKVVACPRRRNVTVTVGPPGSGVHKHTSCKVPPKRRT